MEKELNGLFNEVRLTFNRLADISDRLHADEGITAGMRAVMEFLETNGPHTVPEIARARGVTRQRIQILANELIDAALVKSEANPAHKRSAKLQLSATGQRKMRRMREKEDTALASLGWPMKARDVAQAISVLRSVRETLDTLRL